MPKYFTSIKDTDSAALIFTYNGNDGYVLVYQMFALLYLEKSGALQFRHIFILKEWMFLFYWSHQLN